MNLVLDAGALIALDRADRRVAGLIALGRRNGAELVTTAPVLGQVWRDGARQARLARALEIIEVHGVDTTVAKAAGQLLRKSGTADITDACLSLLAGPGDQILTSDSDDINSLISVRPGPVWVVPV